MKNSKTIVSLLAGGMLAVTCSLAAKPADAAILAQYTFTGGSFNSSDTNANSTASLFTAGPGIPLRTSTLRGDPIRSAAVTFRELQSTSKATALNLGTYYNFSLAPNTGQKLVLNSLQFGTNVGPTTLAGAAGNYFVRYSTDGATFTDIGDVVYTEMSTQPNGDVPFTTRNVDLTPINMSFFTTPVSFRIYEYKNLANNNSNDGGLRVDNVILQGEVSPVPELSTGLLFAMAMIGMGFVAMRRKNDGVSLGKSPFAI